MSVPQGILIRADLIDREGETQECKEFVVTLQDGTIDVRLDDEEDTIAMLDLDEVEEGIKILKRWARDR